ncbi:uncharacterized protein LOC123512684 [Portunus trituberculatus]|uniref:uncharacterized protein LOC123512684 n=1 Tax=Portunus trituberculatus TaxID=210409 RepID=UPI001E1D162B|nr:uncharacterized protein LOC123512684 [Portunus trituberculatus]XP_045125121.1 uncharacterized protein LOC123512684 [Portunus trituberculatus]
MGEGGGGRGKMCLLKLLAAAAVVSFVVASEEVSVEDMLDRLETMGLTDQEVDELLADEDLESLQDKLYELDTKSTGSDLSPFETLLPHLKTNKPKTVGELLNAGKQALDRGQVELTRSLGMKVHRYQKAVRNVSSVMVTGAPLVTLTLEDDPTPSSDWMLHVTALHLHTHLTTTYLLLGSLRTREQRVVVWSSHSRTLRTLAKFQLTDVSIDRVDRTATYLHEGFLFLVLGSSRSRLVSVVCIELATSRVMLPHVITQRGVVGALHLLKAGGNLYLVVGESYHYSPKDGNGRSELYMLVGDFFDKQEDIVFEASGVRDITSFASQGNHYIVFGMEEPKGSKVYALHTRTHTVISHLEGLGVTVSLVQRLVETRVQRVAHFRDQTDLKHFVVVLGRFSSTVYWWNDHRLVKWQTLDTPQLPGVGGSLAALPLPNFEHLLFASAGSNITVYTYHTTGTHQPSFIISTACQSIRDLSAANVGTDHLLVYVCEGPVNRMEARLVHLEDLMEGREEQQSQLSTCLADLRAVLDARKEDVAILQQVVDTDALMTVDRPQVWSGPIVVPEVWVEQTSSLQHTVVIPPGGGAGNQSINEFQALVNRLQSEVTDLKAALGTILYYIGDQIISNPTSSLSINVTHAFFEVVTVSKLHDLPMTRLIQEVLLDGPDQIITGDWQFGQLNTQRLTTRGRHPPGRLNGVLTADLMRRSVADQVVTGRHDYRSMTAGRICHIRCEQDLSILVNGIDTSTIVMRGAHATFTARKTFSHVVLRDTLDVATVNGVSLAQVLDNVVFTDLRGTQVLSGRHAIQRLTVEGNLNVGSVNGVNVRELDKAVVKKHGDYRMAGSVVYKRNLAVQGSTEVQSVNGVPWGELLPLNAPVSISGFYTFARATVLGALRSDNINGLDLSQEAVLLDVDQNIQGRIQFLETVRVTGAAGVRLGEGVTVNGIDPSEVAVSGLGGGSSIGGRVVVVEEDLNITSMQVNGNVVISSINGVDLTELERRFWRKSVSQEIDAAVHINNAVFLGGVEGSTLNGHAVTDYLRADVNQRITGRYTFEGSAEVHGNLVVAQGRRLAGVDVSTLHAQVVTLDTAQTLEEEVVFSGRVTVVGDVDVQGDFLQVLSRGLRLDETIPHTGHLNFAGGAVVGTLQVTGSDITVASLNGLDVAAAAADLVLADQDATITGGVRVSGNVNIRELRVSGLIDGVDVGRMMSRALRTSSRTPQVVTAGLIVEGDVHFARAPTLARVNGEDWATHLGSVVQAGQRERIEGRKLFAGGLRVTGNLQARHINGVQLSALASRILRKSSQQLISAPYTFTGDVTAEELSAGVIDGVNMDEVVLIDQGGELSGSVTFTEDVTFLAGLTADTNVLDSCDFSKLQIGPTLGGSGESVVEMPTVEIDTLVVEGKTFLSSSASIIAQNFDLLQFLNSLVLKSTDQVITADVKFLNDVRVGEMRAAVVDGVDVEALFRQAVLRGDDVVIECDLHLSEGLQVGRLEVKAGVGGVDAAGVLFNGVDLSELQRRAVLRDGGTYVLQGRKVFTAGLATHRLRAATLAGVAVRDLVTVGAVSSRLPSHLMFRTPLTVLGDLWVSGLVDGVDLEHLFTERVRLDVHQTLASTYHFEALRIEGDFTTSSINNVTIADLVLRSGVTRQVISGRKVLQGGLQVNGVLQVGSLNGIDVTELNRTVVRVDDASAVIRADMRFEGEVRCLGGTEVRQTVNGLDLSLLARRVTEIQQRLVDEKQRFRNILSQFGSLNEDNYVKARELYAEMASLERVFLPQETSAFGHLWVGSIPGVAEGHVLKITKCHVLQCGCDIECHYFKVANDTRLMPVHHLGSSVAITTHLLRDGQSLVALHSQCVGGRDRQVKVSLQHHAAKSVLLQGVLLDSAVFVADGVDYLVAAVYKEMDRSNVYGFEDSSEVVRSEVVVVRVDAAANSLHVVTRWDTKTLVVALDVTQAGGSWFLLLANGFGDTSVDRYVTPSEILLWDTNTRRFLHKEEHMGSYLSGGSFVQAMGETFMVLSQYKSKPPQISRFASSCASKVLVFRYNKATQEFVEFQSIAAYGVVSQTTLQVDRSLYLILASPSDHCVYVCLYKHSEGFIIIHKVFLVAPLSVVAVTAGEDTFLLVSTPTGVMRYKVFVKGVDPDTLFLY